VGVRIAVVGGGISGLCAAHKLLAGGHEVTCFEGSGRPGGLIRSERREGFLCEVGPQAILDGSPEVRALIDEVGLASRVCAPAAGARRRLIYVDGKLRTLPSGPPALLSTDLLSLAGKWRLLREPFVRTPPPQDDESIAAFATRRLGAEAARRIAAPAVLGVFAGDAERLSLRSAFPRVAALEAEHGSLLRGMKAARRAGVTAGRSVSFPDGIEELPRALAERLTGRLVAARVSALAPGSAGWTLALDGAPAPAAFDAVVVALGPAAMIRLLEPTLPEVAELRGVRLASVAVAALGFRREDVGVDLGAYGFLVARGERATVLGCQYESTIFPGRAPPGSALLRVILGGVFEPELLDEDDDALVARAVADLRVVAGLDQRPDFSAVWRLREVMPQYELGHEARVAAVERAAARVPGLHLLGMGLRGIGLADCIRNATALARAIGPARAP
jgi:oxygen-dependent protoporphyrinogen oxidase